MAGVEEGEAEAQQGNPEDDVLIVGDPGHERAMQDVRNEIRNLTEGIARNAEEMEERLVNQQQRMEGTLESNLQELNQRMDELDGRLQDRRQEQEHQRREPSIHDWVEAERRHLEGAIDDHERRRIERQYRRVHEYARGQQQQDEGEIQPDVHIDQVRRQQNTFGPTIRDLQRMLPKGEEDISQFAIRLTTLMDKIRHPEKYMVAFERVFNIAHPRVQAQLRTLGCDNAQERSRVRRVLHEFMSTERSTPRIPSPGRQQDKSNGQGYLCEHCRTRGHSARDCPRRNAKILVGEKHIPQTNVVQADEREKRGQRKKG